VVEVEVLFVVVPVEEDKGWFALGNLVAVVDMPLAVVALVDMPLVAVFEQRMARHLHLECFH